MEAGALTPEGSGAEVLRNAANATRRHTSSIAAGVVVAIALYLIVRYGLHDWGQRSLNGLVAGSYYALGAVGLTLVYGILRLTNFAHGDMLTFGAYMALLAAVTLGWPFALAVAFAVAATAVLGLACEAVMFRPMRRKGAGMLQLLLMTIGLAFVLRNGIQLIAGSDVKPIGVDVTSSVTFAGLRIGRTELIVTGVALLTLVGVAVMLRRTLLGKQMRALADNFDLAETTGVDTSRIVIATWLLAGGLAGLGGALYGASVGQITPNLGFFLLLSLFAAVIMGGIGNAYGALVGGLVLGLVQEWATLVVEPRWKASVGFVVLILVLVLRPQGIFGGAHAVTPFGITFEVFSQTDFWISVGVLAGVYGIFTLGLQLNVGFTGILNFGQAGFMAIGAYGMGVLVVKAHWSFGWALLGAMGLAIAAGLVIGLPSLRLRADYFAIVTLAFAETIRYFAVNAREITGGVQGLRQFDLEWVRFANDAAETLRGYDLESSRPDLLPLLILTWLVLVLLTVVLLMAQRTPWGRVLRAVREDEDAARALGKNAFAYKLQSLVIAAAIGAIAGYLLALQLIHLSPDSFEPIFTFVCYAILVLGGLASYTGVALGALLMWTLLEGTRFIDLPLPDEKVAAIRFMLVGLVLILLMAFRPQGVMGKTEEMRIGG